MASSIGAYNQGALNSIGAYEFPAAQEQSNTIGAYDGLGFATVGAYQQFTYDRTTLPTGTAASSILIHYYTTLLGGSRNV